MKKQDYIFRISQFQDDMVNFSGDEEVFFEYMSILDPNDDSYIYDDIEVLKMIWGDLMSFSKRNKKELLEGGVKFNQKQRKLKIQFWKAENALVMQILEQEGLPSCKEEG